MTRRRRLLFVLPAVAIAAAAVTASTGLLGRRAASPASGALTGPPATATVERRTLTRTTTAGGNLGYGESAAVLAAGGRGMVTWLPRVGDVLERGDTVYRVDQQRVPLLYGSIPLYRALSVGVEGADVRQLERNLSALGYAGFTVDDKYTPATAYAVKRWQKHLGRIRTGAVRPGDAVVSSGARRVAQLTGEPGAAASGALLRWTGTDRIVTVSLDIGYADLVRPGAAATVELPGGDRAAARVTAIGTPATTKEGGATLPVELTVTDRRKLGRYEVARVSVDLAAETRQNVLAVPITALVARPGGGYAVVVGTGYVPVKTGLFSDSYVEVAGDGVVEGLSVGVPR
ncbi:peptidoglycan-binding protein [Actinoplanes sp. NPDC051513]|uniref:peptidoglycan-binding protein n=1 Tax=Actinoplanes sp. NPDC051513 TaxID=3363908 RepID=UPI00379DA940